MQVEFREHIEDGLEKIIKETQKVGKMKCDLRGKRKERMCSTPCPKIVGSILEVCYHQHGLKWQRAPDD